MRHALPSNLQTRNQEEEGLIRKATTPSDWRTGEIVFPAVVQGAARRVGHSREVEHLSFFGHAQRTGMTSQPRFPTASPAVERFSVPGTFPRKLAPNLGQYTWEQ